MVVPVFHLHLSLNLFFSADVLADVLVTHENKILMKMKAFLEANELKVCTLAFDGCMHYGPESVTVLGKLNTYMRKEFSCSSLEFVYKPHSTKIAVPTDFDETSVPDKSYKEKCKEFNLTHAKVGDKYICEDSFVNVVS